MPYLDDVPKTFTSEPADITNRNYRLCFFIVLLFVLFSYFAYKLPRPYGRELRVVT